jgi:anti-sigma factor RsiW
MALLDGELSAAELRAVSTHVESCAECANLGPSYAARRVTFRLESPGDSCRTGELDHGPGSRS